MTPLFHLENIVRNYPDPASSDPHTARTVLNLSELDIRAGEILGIRGHNGSGKSTLLRIIALLEPPDSGTVLFEGRPAGTDDLHLRRQVTLLLQTPYLLLAFRSLKRGLRFARPGHPQRLRASKPDRRLSPCRGPRIPPFFCIAAAMSFPAGNASVWPSQPVWPCAPGFF